MGITHRRPWPAAASTIAVALTVTGRIQHQHQGKDPSERQSCDPLPPRLGPLTQTDSTR